MNNPYIDDHLGAIPKKLPRGISLARQLKSSPGELVDVILK
jgi:hypothetical protein